MEQEILTGLLARGIPEHVAVGILRGLRAESGLNPGINEIAPLVPGSRGGYGLAQWTGPRRRQFEAYANERGAPYDDAGTQLDFLLWELNNTEARARDRLYSTTNADEATRVFETAFLRPGIPHGRRGYGEGDGNALAMADVPRRDPMADQPTNALGYDRPRLQLQDTRMDPTAFMVPSNALAFQGFAPGQNNFLLG